MRDVLGALRVNDNDVRTTRSNENEIWIWNVVVFSTHRVNLVGTKGTARLNSRIESITTRTYNSREAAVRDIRS